MSFKFEFFEIKCLKKIVIYFHLNLVIGIDYLAFYLVYTSFKISLNQFPLNKGTNRCRWSQLNKNYNFSRKKNFLFHLKKKVVTFIVHLRHSLVEEIYYIIFIYIHINTHATTLTY